HVEQAEEAPAEIVRRLGIFVVRRLCLEEFVAVEGMQLALEFLLLGELAAGGEDAILRAQMRSVGAARLRRLCSRSGGSAGALARGLGDLQAGDEAFEVTFLLGVEIARHGVAFGFFLSSAHANAPRERPRWLGMLHSSKDRAKQIVLDFVMVFRFRPRAFAVVLGSRRRLRRNSMQPVSAA